MFNWLFCTPPEAEDTRKARLEALQHLADLARQIHERDMIKKYKTATQHEGLKMNEIIEALKELLSDHEVAHQKHTAGLAALEERVKALEVTVVSHRIVCAAIMFNDGLVVPGVRHLDQGMHDLILRLNRRDKEHFSEGFIDNKGAFLTREEARIIAQAAGQIIRRVGADRDRLYSENLY